MKEWQDFVAELEIELGAQIVKKWVPKVIRFDAANIYLETLDSFQISWFEEHVRHRLKGFLNSNNRPIKVHLIQEKKAAPKQEEPSLKFLFDPIDKDLSFEHFVTSEKNLVTYKLLQDAFAFNPIYIFGPKSTGKTHLLMAFASSLQEQNKRVIYVRAETFTDHVVQAIRLGQMRNFRQIYRDIDALIVDDIHILAKKAATQEEFFHTFNTLHTAGKQILLSANCSPTQLKEIEPRLISRFEWGISLEVGKADPNQILDKKAAQWKVTLTDELKEWLLNKFPIDPILPFHALLLRAKGGTLTVEIASKCLKDYLEKQSDQAPTFEKIIKWVANHYGITTSDILGKSQVRSFALPRQVAMYFARVKLNLPFQKIGELFNRDHSTVMSSIKQVQKAIDEKSIDIPPEALGV